MIYTSPAHPIEIFRDEQDRAIKIRQDGAIISVPDWLTDSLLMALLQVRSETDAGQRARGR